MSEEFVLDDNCLAMRVLDEATEVIVADGLANGPWSRLVVELKKRQPTRPSYSSSDLPSRFMLTLDGRARSLSFTEKVRGLTAMPPIVEVAWQSDTELSILGFGSPGSTYEATVVIGPDDVPGAVAETLRHIETAFQSIDGSKTDAFKVKKAPPAVKQMFASSPFMADAAANDSARTVRF
jgi:hypothetical protein